MRILLVEDDPTVAGFVVKGLKEAGHVVEHSDNGRDGLFLAASETFDAIILDRMLPGGIDGIRLLETLRSQNNSTPVLVLSALSQVDDRVAGLKAGGDDYLTKPFAFSELLARVEALLPPAEPDPDWKRVTAARWRKRAPVSPAVRYLKREEMEALAFAAPHRKVMALMKS